MFFAGRIEAGIGGTTAGQAAMARTTEKSSLMDLLTDQLRDLYDAEKQLTKALPKLAKAADDEELAQCFRDHVGETQGQAQRIEQIFESLGMKARGKPCEAMKGLIAEGQEVMSELSPPLLDIGLVAAGRRVEHYEMAGYEMLILGAQASRQTDAVELLKATLKEENETDKRLAAIGKRLLKEAAKGAPAEEAPEQRGGQAKSGGKGRAKKQESGQSGHSSNTTTDHVEIQRWAEERGGKPACVEGTGGKGDIGLLRIEFPGKPNAKDDKLVEISWDDFFEKFDERGLALVYQEQTAEGQKSNFNKLVINENAKAKTRTAR
jgi:ferritin-like metal-binding protein YciE